MVGVPNLQNIAPTKVFQGLKPKQCALTLTVPFDFTAATGQASYTFNLGVQTQQLQNFEFVQTIFVDARSCAQPVLITNLTTQQVLEWPANSQGYLTALWAANSNMTIACADNTQNNVVVQFLNFEVEPFLWGVGSLSISGNVTIVSPLNGDGSVKVEDPHATYTGGSLNVDITNTSIATTEATLDTGVTPYHLVSANTTNATNIKASAGRLFSIAGYTNAANIGYLKIYDKASAPVPASDTPILTFLIPGNTNGAGFNFTLPQGINLALGLGIAITGGIADNDATAVAANAFVVDLGYR